MTHSDAIPSLELPALDGSNPLGFLAALGVLTALQPTQPRLRLSWRRNVQWTPSLHGLADATPQALDAALHQALQGNHVSPEDDARRASTQAKFDKAKKRLKDKLDDIKQQRLRGAERLRAFDTEVMPLRTALAETRQAWLAALRTAVPSPELALGKQIDCSAQEYREDHAPSLLAAASLADRRSIDLLAALVVDGKPDKSGRLPTTPFCFITGSGHQYFLDTARQLMAKVSLENIHRALFEPWTYQDPKLSMRWDPVEDKRYALTDRDPGPVGVQTVWMANLLAYRSLVLFPSAVTRQGPGTTAWKNGTLSPEFTWPLWEMPLSIGPIRSLLQLAELQLSGSGGRDDLRSRGVATVFRSRRVQVGDPPLNKINFSPARSV